MGYNSLTKIYDWNSTVYEKEYEISFFNDFNTNHIENIKIKQ